MHSKRPPMLPFNAACARERFLGPPESPAVERTPNAHQFALGMCVSVMPYPRVRCLKPTACRRPPSTYSQNAITSLAHKVCASQLDLAQTELCSPFSGCGNDGHSLPCPLCCHSFSPLWNGPILFGMGPCLRCKHRRGAHHRFTLSNHPVRNPLRLCQGLLHSWTHFLNQQICLYLCQPAN
jgi:hypothetical protein